MNPAASPDCAAGYRCCLAFEHPVYRSFRDRAPAVWSNGDDASR